MRLLLSAAEASSDVHAAELLRALKKNIPQGETLEVFGTGGPKLQAAGLDPVIDARKLLAMGFIEIFSKLRVIFKCLDDLEAAARERKPDLAVVVDYPDFHFRLALRLRKLKIPVLYYIPPKVWVWRQKRVFKIKELFDRVLCIFPFEEPFFSQHDVPVSYVGNPLLDELPMQISKEEAREQLGAEEQRRVITLMPGSRPSEISEHQDLMLDVVLDCAMRALEPQPWLVLLPFAATTDLKGVEQRLDHWKRLNEGYRKWIEIRLAPGQSALALKSADAGLVKSGTSTLEAALLECPHAVIYKTHWSSALIFKLLVRYTGPVSLVNLIAGGGPTSRKRVVKEILMGEVTHQNLVQELERLIFNRVYRDQMKVEFIQIRNLLAQGEGSPSQKAAHVIWQTYLKKKESRA